MKPYSLVLHLLIGSCLLLLGCSTIKNRVAEKQSIFDQLPLDQQQQILAGQVAVGFTPEMVYMALGEAQRIYSRKTSNSVSVIWSYTDTEQQYQTQMVPVRYRTRTSSGWDSRTSMAPVSVAHQTEYEKTRIEFQDGIVVAVEEVSNR